MDVYAFCDPRLDYPEAFHPTERYPEYPFFETSNNNGVYAAVRTMLAAMGLDRDRFGTAQWNPLAAYIAPGHTVVIKPNLVRHYNPIDNSIASLVTHGSLVRAVVDYCYIAMQGRGTLVIGDAPLQSADFARVVDLTGLRQIMEFYARHTAFDLRLVDFRKQVCSQTDPIAKSVQAGDPNGYSTVDLGADSLHSGRDVDFRNCRVTDYDPRLMNEAHNDKCHKYLISNTVLSADVVVNLPKLKTHRKAGFTGALKNLIGINCLKDYLPHHTRGSLEERGDEYAHKSFFKRVQSGLLDFENSVAPTRTVVRGAVRFLKRVNQRVLSAVQKDPWFEGSWHGNDTLWRTIVDLNRILRYADRVGRMRRTLQRKCLIFVDAVVAGEKEGPLEPSPKRCGLLLAGTNPLAVDHMAARFMGFDGEKIPQVRNGWDVAEYSVAEGGRGDVSITLLGDEEAGQRLLTYGAGFVPSAGWRNEIELFDNSDNQIGHSGFTEL